MSIDGARPGIPDSLYALMAEIGPRWAEDISGHIRLMIEEFSKIHASYPPEHSSVSKNISYGSHPRQKLDLFLPPTAGGALPLIIFVHGGAFVEGDRNRTPQIYSNVSRYFACRGMAGINMGYRLAPDHKYPAASEDIASVVRWAQDHATEFRLDTRRIFLMGHSAGAAHAGSYGYDRRIHGPAGPGLAGLIIVSGRVRADTLDENPNAKKVAAYYGTDAAFLDESSPVSHVDAASVPTFIAMAEFENPLIDLHCMELAHKLAAAKRRAPPVLWLRGHNHTSSIAHINTSEDLLGQSILNFIRQTSRDSLD
jgi:acetyl esterase/lipase